MAFRMTELIDVVQTIAILTTLLFSLWQWKRTRDAIQVDNYSKIVSTLNNLREERLANPDLERDLFDTRKDWTDAQIRRRIYGVMLANVLECTLFSRDSGLIDRKHWEDWALIWKSVILSDANFAELMLDRTIYTFDLDAHKLVKKWVEEIRSKAIPEK